MVQYTMGHKKKLTIDNITEIVTQWIGTTSSILVHTIFFIGMFSLIFFGWSLDQILLMLTTLVSLEAIYLALFIQMTVNKANESIEDVEESIEDVEESIEDVEKDIDNIQAEDKEDEVLDQHLSTTLKTIEIQLQKLQKDIDLLQQKKTS